MTEMVNVACKRPNGLILELRKKDGTIEKVTLKGASQSPFFKEELGVIPGLYGITQVSKEFWDAWVTVHKDYSPFKNNEIFAQQNLEDVKRRAEELKGDKTGLEGVIEKDAKVKKLSEDKK